jgi:hypothetical protein
MGQTTLVDLQLKSGQWFIDRLLGKGIPVTVAGWVKESESGDWYLYLATPLVGQEGAKRTAYRRVNEVIREMQRDGFWNDPFAIKVINPHDSIARDMEAHRARRPAPIPTPFRGTRLGDLEVEEAYIYPPAMVIQPAQLPDAERRMVADFESRGINLVVRILGDSHFECRARYPDGRDSHVSYGQTPEQAVRQTTDNVRRLWSDLFQPNA